MKVTVLQPKLADLAYGLNSDSIYWHSTTVLLRTEACGFGHLVGRCFFWS